MLLPLRTPICGEKALSSPDSSRSVDILRRL
jgi:hypothetical protein